MKKILTAITAATLLATASSSFAAWGLFDADRSYTGIKVDASTTNNYTVWSTTTGNFQGSVLNATAYTSAAQTLQINYYDVKTFKNGGSDVTGGTYNWTVYETGSRPGSPTFSSINLVWLADLGGGDQKWGFSGNTTSILDAPAVSFTSGLKNYTFEFYVQVNGLAPDGAVYDNNGGAASNYTATFSTIPEPSTYAMLALGAAGMGGYVIRRRRR